MLARPFWDAGASIKGLFLFLECAFTFGTLPILWHTLKPRPGERASLLFALSFPLVLIPMYALQHTWPVYYPYDTAALFFTAWGVHAIRNSQWRLLCFIMLVGTMNRNRETTFILPLALLAIQWRRERFTTIAAVVVAMVFAYAAVRVSIMTMLPDLPGPSLHLRIGERIRALNNLHWMSDALNRIRFASCFSVLLLILPLIVRHLGQEGLRLGLVVPGTFLALMVVGNVYEPRIYGEQVVLMYPTLAVAISSWLMLGGKPELTPASGVSEPSTATHPAVILPDSTGSAPDCPSPIQRK